MLLTPHHAWGSPTKGSDPAPHITRAVTEEPCHSRRNSYWEVKLFARSGPAGLWQSPGLKPGLSCSLAVSSHVGLKASATLMALHRTLSSWPPAWHLDIRGAGPDIGKCARIPEERVEKLSQDHLPLTFS